MSAPLEGIKVVELASYVAAPSAGALLADLGAEVIKIEIPEGEIYRHSRPRLQGIKHDFPEAPQFQMDNRGKLSLALDLGKVTNSANQPVRNPRRSSSSTCQLGRCFPIDRNANNPCRALNDLNEVLDTIILQSGWVSEAVSQGPRKEPTAGRGSDQRKRL